MHEVHIPHRIPGENIRHLDDDKLAGKCGKINVSTKGKSSNEGLPTANVPCCEDKQSLVEEIPT